MNLTSGPLFDQGQRVFDAINAKINRVNQFRAQFDAPSNLTLIGFGVGATGPDVAIYMRELFGTPWSRNSIWSARILRLLRMKAS